jgi:hypothetical protein
MIVHIVKARLLEAIRRWGLSPADSAYTHTVETNNEGIVRIPIDQPGLWMIRANHMIPLNGDPKADWLSY